LYSLPQKLAAEFIGTFAFVFVASGSLCADQYLRAASAAPLGWLGVSLAIGIAYAVLIAALAHISGAHLNPAVTVGYWVTKRLSTLNTLFYWIAQVAGAICAAYLLTALIPDAIWRPIGLGTPDLALDFTRTHGMALEAALTFVLVFVAFATAVDANGVSGKIAGFATGLTVTAGMLLGGPFTGAAMNPARAFGPALAAHHWTNHGVYWIGPLFGGILGAVIYDRLFLCDQPAL
jgi:glycerol uptake facilitator protein